MNHAATYNLDFHSYKVGIERWRAKKELVVHLLSVSDLRWANNVGTCRCTPLEGQLKVQSDTNVWKVRDKTWNLF